MDKRKLIPIIIILVIGIGAMVTSYILINKNIEAASETKKIVIANRDLRPYETLNATDLSYADVSMDTDTKGYYTNKSDLIGKIITTSFSKDDWIKSDYIETPDIIKDLVFLTLKTDYTRTGGAKSGDTVDIYHIEFKKVNGQVVAEKEKVAEDVIVINITNNNGESIDNVDNNMLTGTKKIPIEAVKIAVDSKKVDISRLVQASVEQNNGYVFVVKNETTKPLANK